MIHNYLLALKSENIVEILIFSVIEMFYKNAYTANQSILCVRVHCWSCWQLRSKKNTNMKYKLRRNESFFLGWFYLYILLNWI